LSRRTRQKELVFRTHGGKRAGAGRPRAQPGSRVAHAERPAHAARHPAHVTIRVDRRRGNLRRWKTASAVGRAFRAATASALVAHFRVVHFTIQRDHLHLIVEAADKDAFARGMKGIGCRVAKAINRAHDRRRGRVLGDRYHARALTTPAAVRNAIRYVYLNALKHDADDGVPDLGTAVTDGLDPCSSAPWFQGWARPPPAPPPERPAPTSAPTTWLLRVGWALAGPMPRPAPAP
jgi:REP element-mobilizing transposase RayT